ncbi:hypothetical protein BTVI_27516 [Pitangus sulphuratus]|nr:hypothetical protein BTVI_27516 [Pitangus sulphuratus]
MGFWISHDYGMFYEDRGLFSRDVVHISGEKCFCQQAGQSSNKNFKLGVTGLGEDDQQSKEEVKDQVGKQRVSGNVNRRKSWKFINNLQGETQCTDNAKLRVFDKSEDCVAIQKDLDGLRNGSTVTSRK